MNQQDKAVRRYDDARREIRNGDVLLYKGQGFLSRLIGLLTKSPYSHAGLAVWWYDRLMVMEAVGKGVVVTPLSVNVAHYEGGVEWYQYKEEIPEPDRLKMAHFAQQQLGKEYAYWKMISILFYIIFQWRMSRRDELRRTKKLFCSYYVAQVYNSVGRDLKKDESDRFMSPADIANSPALRKIAVLKKDAQDAREPLAHPIGVTKP